MEEFFTALVVSGVLILASIGGVFLFTDYRHFDEVKAHCEKQGYIQNKEIRITCKVDK